MCSQAKSKLTFMTIGLVTEVEIFDPIMSWDPAYRLSAKPNDYAFVAHSVQVCDLAGRDFWLV
jgi:hypothetical protein